METKLKSKESLELQLKNLENQNKVLRMKMQEQNSNGKFLNDLYTLLENDKTDQSISSDENPAIQRLKYFINTFVIKLLYYLVNYFIKISRI